jgi:HlyD family type I secretion membrane fusion protein
MSNRSLVPTQSAPREWYAGVPRSARFPAILGFAVLGVTFAGFGGWASTAPIAGAVVASGSFVATGQNKIVQHLEGGIIDEILVKEGDLVEAGETLIRLDEVAPRTNLRRLQLRHMRLDATSARLEAEIADRDELEFLPHLHAEAHDPEVAEILASQRLTFETRRSNLKSEITMLRHSIEGLVERVVGGDTQARSIEEQLEYFEEELVAKTQLYEQGHMRKPELLALRRARAHLLGELGRVRSETGDARERVARTREQIESVRSVARQRAVEELHTVRSEKDDIREQILHARYVLDRINITAPVKGVVVKMRFHTPGGVIEPGRDVMEILPLEDELIIEVRVRPEDIDSVRRGQDAMVRLVALSQRVTPMFEGTVMYVSADAVRNESRNDPMLNDIYVARIQLDPSEVARGVDFEPLPGMPAEVYIKTNDRTFLEYLVQQNKDSMLPAFREP